ncbi:MAG: arylformamidase [Abditibacteriota bacterium]|nr:arylformamidase [Abditibacteriota bacterium]
MRLIDLSQPLFHECPNCPGHPPVSVDMALQHGRGDDAWQLEIITMASHTGSHLDAPLHKVPGAPSIDQMPLETFVGAAYIADLRGIQADVEIDGKALSAALPEELADKIVLLATGWGDRRARSEEWLHHSPRLNVDGAQWLVEKQVRAIGIDHFSIGGAAEPGNAQTHTVLLGAGLWIVEELRFPPEVFGLPQPLQFWSLPINLRGQSGSWCRPVVVAE